ncbi:MAG: TIR domain-containing protein [Clostridiales bacterium]|nr:TIR domain-containing protein [Clostridiales bacterium]
MKEGYKVFFSRITLESKLGQQYEPYIFAALNSAKVMLAVGTKPEHFNAVWVKNEWGRFLALAKDDRSKLLIPCFRDMDVYGLPDELSMLQSQDMGKLGFIQDLLHGVEKVVRKPVSEPSKPAVKAETSVIAPGVESLYKRACLFLEDGDWKQADEYCEKILDIDPEYAPAYIGKLCAELKMGKEEELGEQEELFDGNANYKKAIRFADSSYKELIQSYRDKAAENIRHKIEMLRPGIEKAKSFCGVLSFESYFTAALKSDGTVVAVGRNDDGQCNTSHWRDIVAISTGYNHTVGLKSDGTVVAVGVNYYTGNWRDIVAISARGDHTVGLKSNGTVVAVGNNHYGQCNTSDWRDIVAISSRDNITVGLKSDGTVVAIGRNDYGQCNTNDWRDIVAIFSCHITTVGLKSDGTVVAVGYNNDGQCETSDWRDIVAILAGGYHTVGLKLDGTVVAAGRYSLAQCNTSDWRDTVAISSCDYNTVGLKSDGTVVVDGQNNLGECNTTDWRDIVAISSSSNHTVGL